MLRVELQKIQVLLNGRFPDEINPEEQMIVVHEKALQKIICLRFKQVFLDACLIV